MPTLAGRTCAHRSRPIDRPGRAGRRTLGMLLALAAMAGLPIGCASPLEGKADRDLRRAVRESALRELSEAQDLPEYIRLVRENRVEQLNIAPETIQQLETMAGPRSYEGMDLPLGPNLFGRPQKVVRITLERCIASSVQHNLNVEFARLAPAVSQQQVVAAEAAFDWIFFTNAQYQSTEQPRSATAFSTQRTDEREVSDATVGVRKPLIAGGQLSLQTQYTNTTNKTPGLNLDPNPAREANFVIQLDQPLLRNFGSDVALSQVRLARNAELDSIAQLKSTLLTNVGDTEQAYWNVVRSTNDLRILQRLLERGEKVLGVLRDRKGFDAKPANLSNAAAAVEARRADVIRGQRILRQASDALKQIMNDPEFPVGSETLLLPADLPLQQAVEFSLVDVINTALSARPEVQRALLSLDNTSIRQMVADNNRLPRLDFRFLTRFSGLGDELGDPYRDIEQAQFVDYQFLLNFEQPIGNRGAEATFAQRRLERMQATIAYRNTVQGVVADVKNALRDVVINFHLIEQTRAARLAAAEDLRTLEVEEQTIQGLTPEFLNLKLQRQQAIAAAEQQEITSLIDYNNALARLYTAMGMGLERNKIQFAVPNLKLDPKTSALFPDYPLEPRRPFKDEIERK